MTSTIVFKKSAFCGSHVNRIKYVSKLPVRSSPYDWRWPCSWRRHGRHSHCDIFFLLCDYTSTDFLNGGIMLPFCCELLERLHSNVNRPEQWIMHMHWLLALPIWDDTKPIVSGAVRPLKLLVVVMIIQVPNCAPGPENPVEAPCA